MRRYAIALETGLALCVSSLLVQGLPSWAVSRLLGRVSDRSVEDTALPAAMVRHAHYLGRVVEAVAAWLPWHPVCLPQALALRAMLRWRRIACSAHLGVTGTAPLAAHAWISVAGEVVQGAPLTGVTELGRFT